MEQSPSIKPDRGRIRSLLSFIYGEKAAEELTNETLDLIERYQEPIVEAAAHGPSTPPRGSFPLSERDAIVITYGDQFHGEQTTPLRYLHRFLSEQLDGYVSGVHILPFFPYTSDDGFSISDYRAVDRSLGSFPEVEEIAQDFRLMADLVLNHCSVSHKWFQGFLQGEEPFRDYFISVKPGTDVSGVFRPRALPLLTSFDTSDGEKLVWTTFSEDQVDLNFGSPAVYLEMLEVLLFYISKGVQIIRLDAIAYLWKELGTPCIHHPKTHAMVKLFRAVMDAAAPGGVMITETNVPHADNISYFGSGSDEAHMVYQFSLPPLTLYTFISENVGPLRTFASTLTRPGENVTFFNFLASHDGVGVLPARGYLSDEQLDLVVTRVRERGGLVSYKATPEGEIPYELNTNYFDAVASPSLPNEQRARLFLASQAVMLAMPGVPGIYIHSLIGSGNWTEGVKETGRNRTINRQKLAFDEVMEELSDEESLRRLVLQGYRDMLVGRAKCPAFHPTGGWRVLDTGSRVFTILRTAGGSPDSGASEEELDLDRNPPRRVLCLHNVSHESADCTVQLSEIGLSEGRHFRDVVSGDHLFPPVEKGAAVSFELDPYEVLWLAY
ncbi:sugar phosphorylase [Salinispira pacifica]